MYNKVLEYLLDYDAEKTISKNGVWLRKIISPVLRLAVPLTLKTKLKVVRKESLPEVPVIFASIHAFKEDIEDAVILADRQAFILVKDGVAVTLEFIVSGEAAVKGCDFVCNS